MTEKINSESSKRKLYTTLYRLGLSKFFPAPVNSNTYIDDRGFVMIMQPDGIISGAGLLSLTGEFIVCRKETE